MTRFFPWLFVSIALHCGIFAAAQYSVKQHRVLFSIKQGTHADEARKNNPMQKPEYTPPRQIAVIIAQNSSTAVPQAPQKSAPVRNSAALQQKTGHSSALQGAAYKKAAQYLENNPPRYPYISRLMKSQGTVVLSITIGTRGTVSSALIEQSAGDAELDRAALSAVKDWKFFNSTDTLPAAPVTIRLPVIFRLTP